MCIRDRRNAMLGITGAIFLFGLILAPMFEAGTGGALGMMALGLALMGMTYGPLGTVVSELFPTSVRYTGSSLAFNFAGILGASLAPYIATWLAKNYGLKWVGYYLCVVCVLTIVGLLMAAVRSKPKSSPAEFVASRTPSERSMRDCPGER